MDGVYTHTVAYEQDPACPICSSSVPFETHSTHTLQQVHVTPSHMPAVAATPSLWHHIILDATAQWVDHWP